MHAASQSHVRILSDALKTHRHECWLDAIWKDRGIRKELMLKLKKALIWPVIIIILVLPPGVVCPSNCALPMPGTADGDVVSHCQVLGRAGSVNHGAGQWVLHGLPDAKTVITYEAEGCTLKLYNQER